MKFVQNKAPQWLTTIRNWIGANRGHPVLVIKYETLKKSPVLEIKKILKFLNIDYTEDFVEKSMVKEFTDFRRVHTKNFDAYTPELREYVHSVLQEAVAYLKEKRLASMIQIEDYLK